MKILLVRPWVNKRITTVRNFLFGEPMGLECVATLLKEAGAQITVADFMVEDKGKLEDYLKLVKPDVVGITSQCTDVDNVKKIANQVKSFDSSIIVMVGGVQATCFPDCYFVESIDYVFKSTTRLNVHQLMVEISEKKAPERIDGIYSKKLGFINEGEFCFNDYVVPDRSVTQRYRKSYKYIGYQPCAIVQTAYGCRNRCHFCVRWKIEGPELREVPIEDIVNQISDLDEPYVMICDNDFLINHSRLERFCELLEERKISKGYMCYGSVNSILEKPELLKRLRANGLLAVIVGYEAFDNKQLTDYNKSATVDENIRATRLLNNANIACWGSFIIHPDWSTSDFKSLLRYIDLLKPELITFSPLVPHPLTSLYETYKDRLLYPVEDYEKWNFGDVLIRPSKMSLKAYYWQVILLTLKVNGNWHSVKYTLNAFPIKNTLKMVFGFKTLFSVYLKNFMTRD
jgi:radical SAM superfamily enzyme YgiQ (UPF0313 family)